MGTVVALRPDANPGRIAVRRGRVVQVRYSPFARIQGHMLHTLFGPTPEQAVGDILHRLGAAPGEVRARPQELGDVAVLRRMPADVDPCFGPGTVQPVAFVDGLTGAEISAALTIIARDRA